MIVLTGGKTGGHIMPLLALAQELKEVTYIGAKDSLEERLCEAEKIPFISLNIKNNHFTTILKAFFSLHLTNVKAIISTGGYVSMPVLLYGIFKHVPIFLLEENLIMGRTNQLISLFAKKVFLAYPLKKMKKKYEVTGIPLFQRKEEAVYSSFDILVIGGSLGSRPLCELAQQLSKEYRVCLIAGKYAQDYSIEKGSIIEYSNSIISLMKASKVVISRCGASTTYELFYHHCPTIVVPSKKTKQNHQYINALYFEKMGCALLLKEDTEYQAAKKQIDQLLQNTQMRHNMLNCQEKIIIRDSAKRMIKRIEEEIN